MSSSYRFSEGGTRIDRTQKVNFKFDGITMSGFKGDTLASALLANGQHLMGRSFKYHRPRGCLTAGSHEPNAIVEMRTGARREPNTRATIAELYDGLEASSQNRFPSLKFDFLSMNQLFGNFLVAGFYYKTFMWPASFWESVYEKIIRRSAGLGAASTESDPDSYEHSHAHCDVLVVGAGPSGLAAATAAAKTGARVILVEEDSHAGGMVSLSHDEIDGQQASEWVTAQMDALSSMKNVTIMMRTNLFGYYDHNVLAALERVSDHVAVPDKGQPRQRLWTIRAKQVALCCGSHERAMTFDNNDKPGVMLSSAVRQFAERFGVSCGSNVAICTNNDDAYKTAKILLDSGAKISAIADARDRLPPVADELRALGVTVMSGTLPKLARGGLSVKELVLQNRQGDTTGSVDCDCVAMSNGFTPDVHLVSQTGVAPLWDDKILGFVPDKPIREERSAGAGNGEFTLAGCLAQGQAAGNDAAKAAGFKAASNTKYKVKSQKDAEPALAIWRCPGKGKAFVDYQNDVTAKDIKLAHSEGMVSVEHVKRYTTLGMSTDQGKTSNVTGIALLAEARGEPIPDVGTTRFRPPYSPVAIGAFAGHERGKEFQPVRRTAMHACGEKLGAVFVEAGQWLRPQYFPKPGEGVMEAIWRESDQVRKTAGMCDVSSLGKIEVFGSDAGEFLNRLYINAFKKLPVGKARYGVMLREDGYVYDDGTTSCLAKNHYLMTTTTANAAGVLAHMEHALQVVWPELDVHFCSATEQWCGVAVAGPNAQKILRDAFGDALDVSDEALPFMGVRTFHWRGTTARVFRVSFSGELAYEVNVGWQFGEEMWDALWAAGQNHGLIPYGTEALSVLRIEKGHVAGNELDGRTTAADMGLGRMASTKKPFIGQVMAAREGMVDENRATLVGLKLKENSGRLRGGAHLVLDKNDANAETSLGWVTSVGDSPGLGCWIGLAYLRGGLGAHEGKTLYAVNPIYGEAPAVEVVSPHFFDPAGDRLKMAQ